jgi:hypothetical protein
MFSLRHFTEQRVFNLVERVHERTICNSDINLCIVWRYVSSIWTDCTAVRGARHILTVAILLI